MSRSRLESVSGHVDRLTRLVDDLLDVSRLRSGSLEIRLEPVDLVDLCKKVVDAHSTQDVDHQITFVTDEVRLEGSWDPNRIHQVLDNLVLNAIKYGPPESTVTLALRRDQNEAVIEVHDSGPGIDERQRSAIFGAFYHPFGGDWSGAGFGFGSLYLQRAGRGTWGIDPG